MTFIGVQLCVWCKWSNCIKIIQL